VAKLSAKRQGSGSGRDSRVQHTRAVFCIRARVELEHRAMRTTSSQHVGASVFAHDGFCPFSRVTRSISTTRSLEHGGKLIG
jgi:hypothetical protein